MFDKCEFANIIKNISETYENQRDFSKKTGINRTYLSKYMNMRLEDPPKPNILKRLADNSNSTIKYNDLMKICGYVENTNTVFDTFSSIVLSLLNPIKVKRVLNNFSYFCTYSVKSYKDFLSSDFYHDNKTIKNFTDVYLFSDFLKLHDLLVSILVENSIIECIELDYLSNNMELLLPNNTRFKFVNLNNDSLLSMEKFVNNLLGELFDLYDKYYLNNVPMEEEYKKQFDTEDDFRFASYNGIDTEGLDEKDIEEINAFIEFIKNKKKNDKKK